MMRENVTEEGAGQEHFDVVIIGAGLSGIDAAYHIQTYCPGKSYVVLENRESVGGTWDLFRYPGIRSDSDMYTFGYSFRPWQSNAAIAHGASIKSYIRETAEAYGIDRNIRFQRRVIGAAWSSADATWTIEIECETPRRTARLSCNFLFCCTGYYDYAAGYAPAFVGVEKFGGRVVHPQQWPQELDYAGKRVVIIGSGATAVTIVPVMAETAAHVTMLQRSPSYVIALPSEDALANRLRRYFPVRFAFAVARWRNVMLGLYFYSLCRRRPDTAKKWIARHNRHLLGDDYDIATHFTPRYNPWEQRLCVAPDADFFKAIKAGNAEVVTDRIETFTETGIRLACGRELEADIVVTATGLKLQVLGGIRVAVDGTPVNFAETMNFKGAMFSDVPNFTSVFGYTNASWTLKSDLICAYIARLINYMDRNGYAACIPRRDPSVIPEPWLDFSSGYIRRSIAELPQQGSRKPWKLYQNYVLDTLSLRFGPINDRALEFVPARKRQQAA